MNERIVLSRYYWWFASTDIAALLASSASAYFYTKMIGPASLIWLFFIGLAHLVATPFLTAHRFVRQQQRIPSREERWRLALASLLLSYVISFLLIAIFSCIARIYVNGFPSLADFGTIISAAKIVVNFWRAIGIAIGVCLLWLFYYFCYGTVAEIFFAARVAPSEQHS